MAAGGHILEHVNHLSTCPGIKLHFLPPPHPNKTEIYTWGGVRLLFFEGGEGGDFRTLTGMLFPHLRQQKGRGRPSQDRSRFDWTKVSVSEVCSKGQRVESRTTQVPLCYSDYLDYYVNHAPAYQRALSSSSVRGVVP